MDLGVLGGTRAILKPYPEATDMPVIQVPQEVTKGWTHLLGR